MREMSITTPGRFQSTSTDLTVEHSFEAAFDHGPEAQGQVEAVVGEHRQRDRDRRGHLFGRVEQQVAELGQVGLPHPVGGHVVGLPGQLRQRLLDPGLFAGGERPARRGRAERGQQQQPLLFHQFDVAALVQPGRLRRRVQRIQRLAHAGSELHEGGPDRPGQAGHLPLGVGGHDEPDPVGQQPQRDGLDQRGFAGADGAEDADVGVGQQPGPVQLERVELERAPGEPVAADVGAVGLETTLGDERIGPGDLGGRLLLGPQPHPMEHPSRRSPRRAAAGRSNIERRRQFGQTVRRTIRRPAWTATAYAAPRPTPAARTGAVPAAGAGHRSPRPSGSAAAPKAWSCSPDSRATSSWER